MDNELDINGTNMEADEIDDAWPRYFVEASAVYTTTLSRVFLLHEEYLITIRALINHAAGDGQVEPVGSVLAYRFLGTGSPLGAIEILEEESRRLVNAYQSLANEPAAASAVNGDILFLMKMSLGVEHYGHGLLRAAARKIMRAYGQGCTLVAVSLDNVDSDVPPAEASGDAWQSKKEYWSKLGRGVEAGRYFVVFPEEPGNKVAVTH